ncbi:hypothetical protein BTGOE7_24670 [Bacillus thuringiensis]|uniref:hypothetical protein n=1 Tax=Bacillus cereus group sp. N18 TaxID=2794590 RepID=UPI000872E8DB|nr:hypothetical protein [Bacillus cereus group sp. N18]OFD07858.1 hypothetical protein BTGOE7_24670 [Bacillus thuringiensis]
MNKNHIWLALLLSLLIVMPWNLLFFYTPMLLPIMGFISKFILYFLLVLVSLQFLQYLKHKTNYEKELVELIKKSNHLTNKEK